MLHFFFVDIYFYTKIDYFEKYINFMFKYYIKHFRYIMRSIVIGLITITLSMSLVNGLQVSILSQELPSDQNQLQELLSKNLDYVHKADISTSTMTVLLNGISLNQSDFILLYDSTPFASKGHVATNLPCDPDNPNNPLFNFLVGRAPDLFVMPLGYIEQISNPGKMCVYHGQFGFGDPVTDVVLKYVGDDPITLGGPHSVVISTHEYYKPSTESLQERQHNDTSH